MPRTWRSRAVHTTAEEPIRVCMHVLGIARTDQRVLREAKALARAGYDVTIVDIEADTSRPATEDFEGLHLRHIFMPARFKPTRFKPFFLVKQARMTAAGKRMLLRTRADVYHAHDANALLACYAAARRRHKPLVFDAHELPFVEQATMRFRLLNAIAIRRLRRMMPGCAGVITVSEHIADELRQRYGGKRAVVVRNMLAYTPPLSSDRLREHFGLSSGRRIGLYQGYFNADRGLSVLVHAGKFLSPDGVIVLMGRGPQEGMLRALIDQEGVADRVKILPAVPYAELLRWTASADLGLILNPPSFSPNVRYCLPNKLFEFLMAGVPVLASQLVEVEAVLNTYDVGAVVPSDSPAAVGASINAMLADPDGLARMRRNALALCQRDFSWEHEQRRLIDLYAQLPDLPRASSPWVRQPATAGGAQSLGEQN